jgi:hypothetical protein
MFRRNRHLQVAYTNIAKIYSHKMVVLKIILNKCAIFSSFAVAG